MIKVVLDTNVFVSSLIAPASVPDQIIDAWDELRFDIVLSRRLLDEFLDVVGRPDVRRYFRHGQHRVEMLVHSLTHRAIFVELDAVPRVVPDDPDDDVVLATAMAADADLIVSGDRHLLALGEYEGIPIVDPVGFVERLNEDAEPE